MPDNPTDDLERLLASGTVPLGRADVRHYPAYNLLALQPQGILCDQLLDDIGEWICPIEKASPPFNRFVDLSQLTGVAVRTRHVFKARRGVNTSSGASTKKSIIVTIARSSNLKSVSLAPA